MRRLHAFSLIELLVVVVILCVLAALGLPAYKRTMASAQRAQCQQNLRQIYTGLINYASDNGNQLPPTVISPGNQEQTWGYQIWPYVYGSYANFRYPSNCLQMGTPVYSVCLKNVFRCPATKEKSIPVPTVSGSPTPARYSYGLNCDPARLAGMTSSSGIPMPLLNVTAVASTVLVIESSFAVGNRYGYFDAFGLTPHGGGTNVLYFDGHGEWLAFAQVPSGASDVFWMGR